MAVKLKEHNKPVGKLGNRVYYFWRDQYVSRAYVKPVQPGKDGQQVWWKKFSRAVREWQRRSDAEKIAYNKRAKPLKMSGFNLSVRDYLNN